MASPKPLIFFFLTNLALSLSSSSSPPQNDTASLTTFRIQTDTHGNLASNWTGPDACLLNWSGTRCSPTGRITALILPSLSLRGPLDSLSSLSDLRLLDLSHNRLNGSLTPLSLSTNLKLLYLSSNDLSGEIPPELSSLRRLRRLDLSDNNLRGAIPSSLTLLPRLLTLNLNDNILSGKIPNLSPNLQTLNLSNNELFGKVPDSSLARFGASSFSGNEALCGSPPFPHCSFTDQNSNSTSDQIVPSNPTSLRAGAPARRGLGTGAIVAIVVANCVAALVITSFAIAHYCAARERRAAAIESNERGASGLGKANDDNEKKVCYNNEGDEESEGTNGSRLVFYEKKKRFELEELLRASAEMLGKGSLGTVYRAVLEDGITVAVKRLKDANPCGRREFEGYMDVIGRLKDVNVVRMRAYYYAKEEKLLVYDYLANGSLHHLLHGT